MQSHETGRILPDRWMQHERPRWLAFLPAAIIVVVGAISVAVEKRYEGSVDVVTHTHLVLGATNALARDFDRAESSQRGLIITGDRRFEPQFLASADSARSGLLVLRTLTRDNRLQQRRLDELERLMNQRLALLVANVSLIRDSLYSPTRITPRMAAGTALTDSVHAVLDSLNATELQLRDQRDAYSSSLARMLFFALVGGAILAMIVALLVDGLMRRDAHQLSEHNILLQEQAVELEEQAAELETQTSDLEAQAAELESHTQDLEHVAMERSKTLRALSQSEERYRSLVEGIAEGVLLQLRDGRIVAANSSAERILGMSAQAIMSRSGLDASWNAIHEDGTPYSPEERPHQIAFRHGKQRRDDVMGVQRGDGPVVWLRVNSQPLFHEGETEAYAVVTSFSDITAQRQLFEQLLQAQKMEAVGQLAGGVAHDFNNVLTVILSYGELLRQEFPEADPRREDVEQIVLSARRGASLTRQLLAFSRRQVVQPRVMQLTEVIGEMKQMIARLIGETVKLEVHLDPETRAIRADPGQVEQILMNLAVNARDAMPDGGTLRIITENATTMSPPSDADMGDAFVLLCVTDTGTGMDDATKRRIFEPFFTTKEQGKGTGLGLSTVYGIVQQAGGRIDVRSVAGEGTSFRIWFPAERTRANRITPVSWPSPDAGHETILVAEDEDNIRELLKRLLTQNGFNVLTAKNGREAMRVARAHRGTIHLLLTDVIMPEMSGHALVEEIGRELPGLRALYISGYTEGELGRYSIAEGVGFVQKPFAANELIAKVRAVLGVPGAQRAEAG